MKTEPTENSSSTTYNLAAITTQLGHAVNHDAPDLFAWIKELTGYSAT